MMVKQPQENMAKVHYWGKSPKWYGSNKFTQKTYKKTFVSASFGRCHLLNFVRKITN